jgi:hypothetical protein
VPLTGGLRDESMSVFPAERRSGHQR